ncbi:polysaccharide biosynthesis C-terminal domain-containing protein [Ruminococcus albus]|uniref:Uncharacterized protein n=1 Tax=Ruminococcus albus (strain ATCC 27210 / DSM 20455 / JCM 14654 / NCDO 2250 / 7) TaxID=697329 RepID=E6UKS9_RUMA7|nr:polysaccharide biosynthesis C-terminal domain-containing protein [Ruminococcus albus]ADU24275.1 hypothetical protein Rumal_3850 [Ruminococcus albus 7 = DSM 20455]
MNKKNLLKNATIGFVGQFITMILGLIVPRIFISSYGSDINGLLTTLTQIFTYMALLEAGIGQAARNALYKPIHDNDHDGVSFIVSAAMNYYRKLTLIYGLAVCTLAVVAPIVLKTEVDYKTIFLVILLEGASSVLSFYYVQTVKVTLNTDGKEYINGITDLVYKVLSYIIRIILALNGISIVILQACYLLLTIGKVAFYRYYFRKNYAWINEKAAPKTAKLNDRNSYIITEIAWTIFSSTDLIVLSVFVSTTLSSVYSVYNMVFVSINTLLNAIYSSINYTLGVKYHEGLSVYEKVHDAFMSVFIGSMTILMSVAYVLTIPFITMYTRSIADVNYLYSELPIMFCLVQILSWSRYIQGNLTGVAGYAKPTSRISLIEAITNITLSIILVLKFGIVGVLFATVIALPLKIIYTTYISDKKVMHRSYRKSITIIGSNILLFIIVVILDKVIDFEIANIPTFLLAGIVLTLVIGAIGTLMNLIINPTCFEMIKSLKRSKRKEV